MVKKVNTKKSIIKKLIPKRDSSKIINKAINKYPQFFVSPTSADPMNIVEGMKAYYEVQNIKRQNRNFWINFVGTSLLTIVIIILTIQTIKLQEKTTAPINPSLEFALQRKIFSASDFIGFVNKGNGTYLQRRATMSIYVTNNGQREAEGIHYTLSSSNSNFTPYSWFNPPILPFKTESVDFEVGYDLCRGVNTEEEHKKAVEGPCNQYDIGGLMRWFLKVDCESCHFPTNNPECFSFNICIMNSTINGNDCKELLKKNSAFTQIDCLD
jgi:hypothetical protein